MPHAVAGERLEVVVDVRTDGAVKFGSDATGIAPEIDRDRCELTGCGIEDECRRRDIEVRAETRQGCQADVRLVAKDTVLRGGRNANVKRIQIDVAHIQRAAVFEDDQAVGDFLAVDDDRVERFGRLAGKRLRGSNCARKGACQQKCHYVPSAHVTVPA